MAGLTGPAAGNPVPGTPASPGAGPGVESGPGQAGAGDAGPVGAAARRVGGIEPLPEELAEPAAAGRAAVRQPLAESRLELGFGDDAIAVAALDARQRAGEVRMTQDLAQGDVGDAGALIGRRAAEQAERCRVRRRGGPEPVLAGVARVELLDQAALERAPAGLRAGPSGLGLGGPGGEQELAQRRQALLEEGQVVAGLAHVVAPPLVHVLVVQGVGVDLAAGEGDHRLHLLLEGGGWPADDHA